MKVKHDALLLAAVIAVGLAFTLGRQVIGHNDYLVDLRAFYCGGSVLLHHGDPYLTPGTACVNAIHPGAEVLPAPHPPFAMAYYALLALLPFTIIGFAYIIASWLALAAAATLIAKLVPLPSSVVGLVLAPLLGYYCTSLGQPTAIVALFIVLCAFFLVSGRPRAAAVFAALCLVFPQTGLPIVAALFICRPNTRIALTILVAVLAFFGLAVLGFDTNVHYLTVSLPLQQLHITTDPGQYSLPWLLNQLHVPVRISVLTGEAWYVALILAGIVWLERNARDVKNPLPALLPPALAALCAPYVHPQHFALALPLALVAVGSKPRSPFLVVLGTALLLVPWTTCVIGNAIVHDAAKSLIFVVLGIASAALLSRKLSTTAIVAAIDIAVLLVIHVALRHTASAEMLPNTLPTLSIKLPTILGLVLVLSAGIFVQRAQATSR